MLDILRPDVKIDVLTNLSVKLDNNKIYEKLKTRSHVLWNISFDNVEKRFEYVRHGADWELFKKNIARVQQDFGKYRLTFHPVYSIWNAINLVEYYDFAAENSARVNWQLALPKVDSKEFTTDSFVVFGHKKRIIERAVIEIDKLPYRDELIQGLQKSLITDIEKPGKDKSFLEWTARMENFMPPIQKFEVLWPELLSLLNV